MRLVLDTDVMVAAFRSPTGASRAILRAGIDRRVQLLASNPLLFEYEAVLKREEHLSAARATIDDVDVILDMFTDSAEQIRTHYLWRPQLKDAFDELVLETAVNGAADVLVTFNLRDFGKAPGNFGVTLALPRDVIGRL